MLEKACGKSNRKSKEEKISPPLKKPQLPHVTAIIFRPISEDKKRENPKPLIDPFFAYCCFKKHVTRANEAKIKSQPHHITEPLFTPSCLEKHVVAGPPATS